MLRFYELEWFLDGVHHQLRLNVETLAHTPTFPKHERKLSSHRTVNPTTTYLSAPRRPFVPPAQAIVGVFFLCASPRFKAINV